MNLFGELRNPFFEFGDRLPELLLSRLMRRDIELSLHLRSRETQGFELADAFGIALEHLVGALLFLFPFFKALSEAGFRVDQAFPRITHRHRLS